MVINVSKIIINERFMTIYGNLCLNKENGTLVEAEYNYMH